LRLPRNGAFDVHPSNFQKSEIGSAEVFAMPEQIRMVKELSFKEKTFPKV